jgi:hypothetical protein
MASSPKIKVSIPSSLRLSPADRSALKKAFQADVVRILRRLPGGASNDIINVKHEHPSKKKAAKKKAAKKAGKKE